MKGDRSLRSIQAQSTKGKWWHWERLIKEIKSTRKSLRQKWWIPPTERLLQKPRKLHAGQDWFWWARKDDLVHHCGGNCFLASFFLTPARRFQLLLLYHVFPEIWRLAKDKQANDDHCDQDQGEEDHEENIGGMGKRFGQWLLSWDHIGQVQHVAQSPSNIAALDLAHEMNILPGISCEMIATQKERENVGSRKAVFPQVLLLYITKIYLHLFPRPRAEVFHCVSHLFLGRGFLWCKV